MGEETYMSGNSQLSPESASLGSANHGRDSPQEELMFGDYRIILTDIKAEEPEEGVELSSNGAQPLSVESTEPLGLEAAVCQPQENKKPDYPPKDRRKQEPPPKKKKK